MWSETEARTREKETAYHLLDQRGMTGLLGI